MKFKFSSETALVVVINEQHTLLPQQEQAIEDYVTEYFGDVQQGVEYVKVPAAGWDIDELRTVAVRLSNAIRTDMELVFVSPVPFLIRECSRTCATLLMHNDRREKRELPGGKVIYTVAKEGWQLV